VLLAITIIGIPFAVQSLKLAALAVNPLGKRVVRTATLEAALSEEPANAPT
jgi:uncharacterized membrane protein YccF (DUF307 family)